MRRKKKLSAVGSAPPLTDTQRTFLAALCDRHYEGMFKYACSLTSPGEAEDIVQELFLLAARKVDVLMAHPCPDGWLAKSLVFLVKNHAEREGVRQKHSAGSLDTDTPISVPDKTGDVDTELSLQEVLTPQDYMLYRMIYYEGCTVKEAAALMGLSPAAIWKRMERLRKKIREEFPY